MPLLFVFSYTLFFLPIVISIFNFFFIFKKQKKDDWNKKSIIVKYISILVLLYIQFYFLYGLKFIDPEYMFLYPFWCAPGGISLIFTSQIVIDRKLGSRIEVKLAYVILAIAIFTLIAPFIFIMLRERQLI
jgi:hypothetical protein